MTKREVVSWMGQPTRLGNQDTWTTGSSPTNSDLPTITVEYGRDGVVSAIYVDGY